jgi:hypothetical protein
LGRRTKLDYGLVGDTRAKRERHFYLRRRNSDYLGVALFKDEWQAPFAWILRARLHSECFTAGNRRSAYPPDRQIIAMSGDGGISMLLGDLLTLHQLNLPVKIVVFRNDFSPLR